MPDLDEQLQAAAPKPTGPLDVEGIRTRAVQRGRRRRYRRVVGGGVVALGLVLGGVWIAGRDAADTLIGDPVEPAEEGIDEEGVDEAVEADPPGGSGEFIVVTSSVATTVGEGHYRCEVGDEATEVTSTVTSRIWSDPANARWKERTEFADRVVERLIFGNPYYPTETHERGAFPEVPSPCPSPHHPALQVVGPLAGGNGPAAVLSSEQEAALEGLVFGSRELGVESGPGVDSTGRPAVVWVWENQGGTMSWEGGETMIDQETRWYVDPDTDRVLEQVMVSDYHDYGAVRVTTTYGDDTMVTVDAAEFSTAGYDDVTAQWSLPGRQRHVAVRSAETLSNGSEWLWPAEPVDEDPLELVARFVRDVLGEPDAVLGEPTFLFPSVSVMVGDLQLVVQWWEDDDGVVITAVATEPLNGSDGVNAGIAPGAVLAIEVPTIAPSYTIAIGGPDVTGTWVVDGIEVTDLVADTMTHVLPDGSVVSDDIVAQAEVTIPGLIFSDAHSVLAIGRDGEGDLVHVAGRVLETTRGPRAEGEEPDVPEE